MMHLLKAIFGVMALCIAVEGFVIWHVMDKIEAMQAGYLLREEMMEVQRQGCRAQIKLAVVYYESAEYVMKELGLTERGVGLPPMVLNKHYKDVAAMGGPEDDGCTDIKGCDKVVR